MIRKEDALDYHSQGRPGKIEVVPTKPCITQRDLSLAYTPGVAEPCLRIQEDPESAFTYTARGNLVAVVSNGTAVLGLGNIGALASKPVMEGKGVLFKRFADIDVFDLELNTADPEEIIRTIEMLEPTFGGINLEDIKAPECFHIEEELKRRLSIPVFHDDQHGTAIISGAALINAVEIVGKSIESVRVVFNGAGASGIACARYYLALGVRPENLLMCDSRGVLRADRDDLNPFKRALAQETDKRTLSEALVGADVFVGLSCADVLGRDHVRSMADRPIIFAMANPTPEISYEEAKGARDDAIVATGRSDYPNQVNNVLGFPFIFRGALDVGATAINMEMKLAATRALAELAKHDVPESVMKAYGLERLHYGPDYLIPKPFDRRVLIQEAAAVARAAMESGVARRTVDVEEYKEMLERRLGKSREVIRLLVNQARRRPKRIVLADGENPAVLRAAQQMNDEGFAHPILLGDKKTIHRKIDDLELHLAGVPIVDPSKSDSFQTYTDRLHHMRCRKGVTRLDAARLMRKPTVFGAMMVHVGDADGLVAGIDQHFPDALRPVLGIIGTEEARAHTLHMMVIKDRVYFLADTAVNIDPTAEELAEIAISTADFARRVHIEPRIAMLSFSSFGSVRHPLTNKVRLATGKIKERRPDLMVDGEMQVDPALMPDLRSGHFPACELKGPANVLIFPDLNSANAGFMLLHRLGGAEAIGPVLTGMRKPVHILQLGCGEKEVLYLAALATVDAQEAERQLGTGPPRHAPIDESFQRAKA